MRVRVMTDGGRLRCDGKTLELTGATAEIDQGLLDLGRPDRRCRELYAPGEGVVVRLGATTRRYRGALRATVLDGRIALFNELSVEDYLRGVVGSELAGKPEALKAQAVVSRTYALAGRNRHERAGYDVCDLTHCQLYRGRQDERPEVDKAVEATRGRVLRGRHASEPLAPAYFHSSCGGATSTAASVFGASEAPARWRIGWARPGRCAPAHRTTAGTSRCRGRSSPGRWGFPPRARPSRCCARTAGAGRWRCARSACACRARPFMRGWAGAGLPDVEEPRGEGARGGREGALRGAGTWPRGGAVPVRRHGAGAARVRVREDPEALLPGADAWRTPSLAW
ncbi:SpoIID/LytB domain-containing protein [Cystobacter fuscus]